MRTNLYMKSFYLITTISKRITVVVAVLYFAFWLNGCDDFTEVGMPVSELNTAAIFEQRNTAYAAMNDVYAKMRENGVLTGKTSGTSREMGLYTDEMKWYGSSTSTANNFYNNTVLPSIGTIANWWNFSYSQIYGADCIISGVAASTTLTQEDKDQLTGEAKFVRGMLHFYLLQLYGAVPYVTSTDYKVNSKAPRMPEAEVYQKIIADLEGARALLKADYATAERVRPNSFVATALLARVYLYQGAYAQASNSASAVMNNTDLYVLPDDLNSVFLKESSSTIWQFSPRTTTRNTDEGQTFIFNAVPPSNAGLTSLLISSFEAGDQRLTKWIASLTSGESVYYHPFKYKKLASSSPQVEYSIVLRLQEMYLIRAEARTQQGELIGAKEDLNVIRNAAGLENTTAVSKTDLLTAVLHERRVEFFTEYGHRFMDLKRAGKLDDFLSYKPSWQSTDRLLPLPQKELNLNSTLGAQNPGY